MLPEELLTVLYEYNFDSDLYTWIKTVKNIATQDYVNQNKGTKLYRHRIFTQSSTISEINVLSTSKNNMANLLTSGTIKLFENGVLQIYTHDKLYTQIYSYGGSSSFTDANGSLASYVDLGTCSDTVTPL